MISLHMSWPIFSINTIQPSGNSRCLSRCCHKLWLCCPLLPQLLSLLSLSFVLLPKCTHSLLSFFVSAAIAILVVIFIVHLCIHSTPLISISLSLPLSLLLSWLSFVFLFAHRIFQAFNCTFSQSLEVATWMAVAFKVSWKALICLCESNHHWCCFLNLWTNCPNWNCVLFFHLTEMWIPCFQHWHHSWI